MSDLESIVTEVPGPRSRALAGALAATETRGVTYLADDFPVFWESGSGATVVDVDGNRYLDLSAAFGVALTGHANAAVAAAIAAQAARLPHGMGDVHPSDVKVALLKRLADLVPVPDPRIFLCTSGSDSIEFARKSAMLATGKPDAVAFEGAYHGLAYGALELGGLAKFRAPWEKQLGGTTRFVRFPDRRESGGATRALRDVESALRLSDSIGAVFVEPIQGRAGVIVPADGFLGGLRALCDRYGALLVIDEIFTGFGRTGTLFACEREQVIPDVLCVGKALGGGFPLSAAIVRRSVADAWPPSSGEALHTATYLGNPMGCAAALANLREIERMDLVERARVGEASLDARLNELRAREKGIVDARGRGMLWAVEFSDPSRAATTVVRALGLGLIVLRSGAKGETLTIAPPLVIDDTQLARALDLLEAALA